jgi:hypothetical protein
MSKHANFRRRRKETTPMTDTIKPAYPETPDRDRTHPPREPSPFAGRGGNDGGRMPPSPAVDKQPDPEIDGP